MKCYLINLDWATDRLAFQKEQFASRGLEFERVSACLDDPLSVDRFRWWCSVLRPRVRGEVGCVLSHVKTAQLMLANEETCAAIFEDDVRLSDRVAEALCLAEKVCRRDPLQVVLLGNHHRSKRGEPFAAPEDVLAIEDESWDFGTEGYVIGWKAAKNLSRVQAKVRTYPDAWGYFRKKRWIRLSRVVPAVCGQAVDEYESSLGDRYVVAEHGVFERCWWKLRRVVGVVIGGLLDGGRFGW